MAPIKRIGEAQMAVGDFSALDGRDAKAPVYMDAETLSDAEMWERIKSIHEIDAGARVGTYSVYPPRNYWNAIASEETLKYKKFIEQAKFKRAGGAKMDVIMPSLYAFYNDVPNWLLHAKENIDQAEAYGKEVFPFIWFDYHDQSNTPDIYVGDDYWRTMIKECLDRTGNAIIWGGWDLTSANTGAKPWDENAPWLKVVQEFL